MRCAQPTRHPYLLVLLAAALTALSAAPTLAQSPRELPPQMAAAKQAGEAEAADRRRAAQAQGNDRGAPRTLFVDKDGLQCPRAEFKSVQAAVAAAPPRSSVMVCPDIYTEEITVNKPLRLMEHGGGNGEVDERSRCFEAEPPNPTRDAIVEGSIYLFGSRILLDGFVVKHSPTFGIYVGGADVEVRDNLVQQNEFGLFMGFSNGVRAHDNCFRENALGVSLDSSNTVQIDRNAFSRNSYGGAELRAGGDVRFDHNTSRRDEYFFVAAVFLGSGEFGTTGGPGSISYNESEGSGSEAAVIAYANPELQITHNRLRQATDGIFLDGNDSVEVAYNDIAEMRRDGIRASFFGIRNSHVAFNRLSDNGQDGLNLQEGNSNNRVEHNDARRNGSDGIHAEGAEGNVFRTNVMFDNLQFDARDDKRPANRWIQNQCRTDLPPGTICGVSDPSE